MPGQPVKVVGAKLSYREWENKVFVPKNRHCFCFITPIQIYDIIVII